MNETTPLARKLQLKPGSRLWIRPDDAAAEVRDTPGIEVSGVDDADVALIFATDKRDVDSVLTEHRDALAHARAVWIVYAKGNRTDMNRDTLWVQLAEYGWRAVSQVAYDDVLSAIRVRPLKDGEASPV